MKTSSGKDEPRLLGFEVRQVKFTPFTFGKGESYPMLICIKPF